MTHDTYTGQTMWHSRHKTGISLIFSFWTCFVLRRVRRGRGAVRGFKHPLWVHFILPVCSLACQRGRSCTCIQGYPYTPTPWLGKLMYTPPPCTQRPFQGWRGIITACIQYAVKAQMSLAPLSRFHSSRVTTAHAHQCCRFQSYAKTVPSRMKLAMKLTMREPASMTTDTWSRRVTSDFNSVL